MTPERLEELKQFHEASAQEYLKAAYADGQMNGSQMLANHKIYKETAAILGRLHEFFEQDGEETKISHNHFWESVYYILSGHKETKQKN